jgi:hypothetical protein
MTLIPTIAVLLVLSGFVLMHFIEKGHRVRSGVAVWTMRLMLGGLFLLFIYALLR